MAALVLFWLSFSAPSQAQKGESIAVYFQDFHSADVTHLITSPDENWAFTADLSGKILMWNVNDLTVYRTIRDGQNYPVTSMRLHPTGNLLMVASGPAKQNYALNHGYRAPFFEEYNSEADTTSLVLFYPIFRNTPPDTLLKNDVSFYGGSDDGDILLSIHQGQETGLYGFTKENDYNTTFGFLLHQYREGILGQASYHSDLNQLALSFSVMGSSNRLALYDADAFDLLYSIDLVDEKVIALRYDHTKSYLYAITYNRTAQTTTSKVFDTESGVLELLHSKSIGNQAASPGLIHAEIHLGNSPVFMINDRFAGTTLISFNEHELKKISSFKSGQVSSQLAAAILSKTANRVVFPSENGLALYDLNDKTFINRHQRSKAPFVLGTFLPGNHTFYGSDEFQKFYEAGSLVNRFSRTGLASHLLINHEFEALSYGFGSSRIATPLDQQAGKMAIFGRGPQIDGNRYYIYDIINDTLSLLKEAQVEFNYPIQYSHLNETILAQQFLDERAYAIITKNQVQPFSFSGEMSHLNLSIDGNYLLKWIRESNTIKIHKTEDLSIVYEHKLEQKPWNIKIGNSGVQGFYIGFQYETFGLGRTVVIEPRSDQFVTEEVPFMIKDWTQQGNVFAFLSVSGYVGLYDGRFLVLDYAADPVSISLNDDADRLMVSFSNGMIIFYDVSTLEEVVRMVHPDAGAHVMINRDGYYSANIDARQWLAVRSENGPLPFEQSITKHQPQRVLQSLGRVKPEMEQLLEQSTRIRMRNNAFGTIESIPTSSPFISNIRLNGEAVVNTAHDNFLEISFDVYDESSPLAEMELLLNGTPIPLSHSINGLPPGETHSINSRIELVRGENIIHLTITNQSGGSSPRFERSIRFDSDDKPNLYLLSIGVSEYEDEAYNLVFADKDAWDMAILMGEYSEEDLASYLNRFHGHRFTNHSNLNSQEIRSFANALTGRDDKHYLQISEDGRYWIVGPRYYSDSPTQLWDFKTGMVKNIKLPNLPNGELTRRSHDHFISYPSTTIAYIDTSGALNTVDLLLNDFRKYNTEPFEFERVIRIGEAEFIGQLTYSSRRTNDLRNQLIFFELNGDEITYSISPDEIEWGDNLRAVSADGEKFLFSSGREFYVVHKDNVAAPISWDGFSERGWRDEVNFSKDGDKVYSLHQRSGSFNDPTQTWVKYRFDLATQQTDSMIYSIPTGSIVGMNISGGKRNFLNRGNPISQLSYTRHQQIESYASQHASSFNQVHVKKMVNEHATGKTVKEAIESFFSEARPHDQIVLFLAGHGVLDQDYSYYFAAADFDFLEPSANGVSYEEIIRLMSTSPSTRRLLLMDTCHAGEVFEMEYAETGTSRFDDGAARTITRHEALVDRPSDIIALLFDQTNSIHGITVITASGGAEVAYETTELSNGAFTTAFMELVFDTSGLSQAFRFGPERSTVLNDDMMREIGSRVMRYTGGRQVPNIRERNRLSEIYVW